MSQTTRIFILLLFLMLPCCVRMPVDDCDQRNIHLWKVSRLPGCLRDLLLAGSVSVEDRPKGDSGLELHGFRDNPDPEPVVQRGGGFPDVLGVPLYSERAWQWGYSSIVSESYEAVRPKAPPWLEVRLLNARNRLTKTPSREIFQFLSSHVHRFEHRYQQKYPWAAPRVGQRVADGTGPDGKIHFSMSITSDGRIVRCRSREPEVLRGLGERVCSEMETWKNLNQANNQKFPVQVEFDLIYQSQKPACWEGSSEYLDLRERPRAPAPICWAPWKK